MPSCVVRTAALPPLSSTLACRLQPTLAPSPPPHDHLPQFAESHADEATAHMHDRHYVCIAALYTLPGGQPEHGQEGRGGVEAILGASHRPSGSC
eukprot:4698901-Pleurochrysis_carterae.AAC.1